MVRAGFLYNNKRRKRMNERNVSVERDGGAALFCAIALNGNMVGQRGGTFGTRHAIFLEKQKEETSISSRSNEDE
jgi:hypothetical protein